MELVATVGLFSAANLAVEASDHGRLREADIPSLNISASAKTELSWGFFTRHYEDDAATTLPGKRVHDMRKKPQQPNILNLSIAIEDSAENRRSSCHTLTAYAYTYLSGYDINTNNTNNSPDRDSTSVLSRVLLPISSPKWKRSTLLNWAYDIATARDADGSKNHLNIALY
ncbi:hypothetical protein F4814DRAFT_449823 [Daldinia grandis]|nr:hypothetical protein F4814DRAFT_449823 [Daldinia grandis]